MEISKQDTMSLIRMAIKYSDSLNELDELQSQDKNKLFKFEIRKSLTELNEFAEPLFTNFLREFMKEYELVIIELMEAFRETSKKIKLGNEERTNVGLLYAKIASCIIDVKKMEYKDEFLTHLQFLMEEVVIAIEKQAKFLFGLKDAKGFGINELVWGFNELSNKTMYANENDN
jgi:hypothetical protein